MRPLLLAALCAVGAAPALAQKAPAGRVSAAFTFNSLDLSTLALEDGREAYLLESLIQVAAEPKGPIAGLTGRCLLAGTRHLSDGRHVATGTCAFDGGGGDRLFLVMTDGSEGSGAPARGTGRWTGGTGRFAGAAGEVTYSLVTYGLRPVGTYEGTGRVEGLWATD